MVALACSACGSGNGGGGVNQSAVLGDLSQADAEAMCADVASQVNNILSQSQACLLEGFMELAFGGDEATCTAAVAACESSGADPVIDCSMVDASDLAGCTATVGEFLNCLKDGQQALKQVMGGLSCTSSLMDLAALDVDTPQSCVDLEAKCPGLT
jgi:hypothetical protein